MDWKSDGKSVQSVITRERTEELHEHGILVLERFFNPHELQTAQSECKDLYKKKLEDSKGISPPQESRLARQRHFDLRWFEWYENFPYQYPSLNLLGLHPRIGYAVRTALATEHVYMHQNFMTAKIAGLLDYEQPLHRDYIAHTLLVPSRQRALESIICVVYLSDVTEADGALSYVPLSLTKELPLWKHTLSSEENEQWSQHERLALGSAGTLVMYYHDLCHRGTSPTSRDTRRYQLTASYHSSATSSYIGGLPWQSTSHNVNWGVVFEHATPEQLQMVGIPAPGHPYWTAESIAGVKMRYPGWDQAPYLEGL